MMRNERCLADVAAGDQCTDRAVREMLEAQGDGVECVVSRDGTVFVVRGSLKRTLIRALLRLVKRAVGESELVEVTPTDMRRWRESVRRKSGDEQAAARKEANVTVSYILGAAIEAKASDIYLDVRREHSAIAFRTFGFSRAFEEVSREAGLELAGALWSLGENAQFQPSRVCDVAFNFEHRGHRYRVRGNSIVEVRGNSVVCRIRDPSFVLPLRRSGYRESQVRQIERVCRAPGGLIVVSGETNSGKSTTVAGLVSELPRTQKIIEIADPVEVEFEHVTHVEVQHYGEGAAERIQETVDALVRQNPDTLILGEIRDGLTADMAQRMAIQGKRVLSTVHTQSCASAIPRLANLGIPLHLLGTPGFLAGIVNQNLVPVTCPGCGLEAHPDERIDGIYRQEFGNAVRFVNEKGCEACSGGVSGQTLVAECYPLWLDRTGRARELIAAGQLAELERYMREEGPGGGSVSKHRHAAEKIRAGTIDPAHTESIIGEFCDDDLVEPGSHVVELQR